PAAASHSAVSHPTIPPPTTSTLEPTFTLFCSTSSASATCDCASDTGRDIGSPPTAITTSSKSLIPAKSSARMELPVLISTPDSTTERIKYCTNSLISLFLGGLEATRNLPPSSASFSNRVTLWPLSEATLANSNPPGPPPMT